jgi:hypothetical protein
VQTAFDPAKNAFFEALSFSPAHALAVYPALSQRRLSENGKSTEEITNPSGVPA